MPRKLKKHEKVLLKKASFFEWESDNGHQAELIMKRYHLKNKNEYVIYNKIAREARELAKMIRDLDQSDPFRIRATAQLLDKLYQNGFISKTSNLENVVSSPGMSVSAIARRRLPVIMVKMKMAQNVKMATSYVKAGHVRLGPTMISDPATIVTRRMEDFITWRDGSKLRQHIADFNNARDDFDMENC